VILARQLAAADIPIETFADLAPFEVLMLHPGRTPLEKLLRVNNMAKQGKDSWYHKYQEYGRGKAKLAHANMTAMIAGMGDDAPDLLKQSTDNLGESLGGEWPRPARPHPPTVFLFTDNLEASSVDYSVK
jgi:hypothetical protein